MSSSHLGKPVPDHLGTARPPITVAQACAIQTFLGRHPHTRLCSRDNRHTPSKCNRPPLLPQRCPSTLVVCPSPPLVADCALWLAAAARCQDLFRERAGAGWAGGGGGGGVRAHTGASGEPRSSLQHPTLPNSLLHTCCSLPLLSILESPQRQKNSVMCQF